MNPPVKLEEQLFRLRTRGPLPVLAHPERYHALVRHRERMEAIGRTAALLVDWRRSPARTARAPPRRRSGWCEDGLAHACASDVHDAEDARAAGAGIAWLRKTHGRRGRHAIARRKSAPDLARRAARLENHLGCLQAIPDS